MQTEIFTAFAQQAEQALGRRKIFTLVAGGVLLGTTALLPLPAVADKKRRETRRARRRARRRKPHDCNQPGTRLAAQGSDEECEDDS